MTSSGEKTSVRPIEIAHRRPRICSRRTLHFTESVIREMTRLAMQVQAVNLAQGFPDFSGAKPLRDAIAAKYRKWSALDYDPEREITVCCGSTEGTIASLLAVTNPGDEVIVFEPYYENYGPDTLLCDAQRKLVALRPPDWTFDPDKLRAAFSSRTKAIILNSPNNPTGKVFFQARIGVHRQPLPGVRRPCNF